MLSPLDIRKKLKLSKRPEIQLMDVEVLATDGKYIDMHAPL
jgi:hypothetical protein